MISEAQEKVWRPSRGPTLNHVILVDRGDRVVGSSSLEQYEWLLPDLPAARPPRLKLLGGVLSSRSETEVVEELGYPTELSQDHCGLSELVVARLEERTNPRFLPASTLAVASR